MTLPPIVAQRWERPEIYEAPPGFWKRQLSGDVLAIAAHGDVAVLKQLLAEQPEVLNQRGSHGRTLLWEAVRAGRTPAVRLLIEAGADLTLTCGDNNESVVQLTPAAAARYYKRDGPAALLAALGLREDVFRLAFQGDREDVKRELAAQPALLDAEDPCDQIYLTPLIAYAIAGGRADIAQDLLARGAQVSSYSAQLLYFATRLGRVDLIDLLLSGGADIRAVDSGTYMTTHLPALILLLERGAPVNNVGRNGFPPLVYLARADKGRRMDVMQLLLSNGADVNGRGPHGRTALHLAAAAGNTRMMTMLLTNGAEIGIEDDDGKTALQLARSAGKTQSVGLLKSVARTTRTA